MTYRGESATNKTDFSESESENTKPEKEELSKSEKYWENVTDPLQAYFKDCKRYPLLSPEKQKQIFQRYQEFQNPKDRELLIVSNLRLVAKIASKYRKFFSSIPNDLIQEGNMGLMRAVEKYDPDRNVKFSYCAAYWIK